MDDDEIFSKTFDNEILSFLEPYICSSVFQIRFALSSKPYSISMLSFISALNALDKTLNACASRYKHFFFLEFEDNPSRHEKGLHLSSIKFEDLFHVNKKTFEIFMKKLVSLK
jgi:hypothetical protein